MHCSGPRTCFHVVASTGCLFHTMNISSAHLPTQQAWAQNTVAATNDPAEPTKHHSSQEISAQWRDPMFLCSCFIFLSYCIFHGMKRDARWHHCFDKCRCNTHKRARHSATSCSWTRTTPICTSCDRPPMQQRQPRSHDGVHATSQTFPVPVKAQRQRQMHHPRHEVFHMVHGLRLHRRCPMGVATPRGMQPICPRHTTHLETPSAESLKVQDSNACAFVDVCPATNVATSPTSGLVLRTCAILDLDCNNSAHPTSEA